MKRGVEILISLWGKLTVFRKEARRSLCHCFWSLLGVCDRTRTAGLSFWIKPQGSAWILQILKNKATIGKFFSASRKIGASQPFSSAGKAGVTSQLPYWSPESFPVPSLLTEDISSCLLRTYLLQVLYKHLLIFRTTPWGRYYYYHHLTNEETKAQNSYFFCPRS